MRGGGGGVGGQGAMVVSWCDADGGGDGLAKLREIQCRVIIARTGRRTEQIGWGSGRVVGWKGIFYFFKYYFKK